MKTQLITLAVPHDEGLSLSENTESAAQAVPGSYVVNSEIVEADLFKIEGNDEALALPMGMKVALEMMDEGGYVSVVVPIDQHTFLDAPSSSGGDTLLEDTVHARAFDFGFAVAASATIVGVQGDTLLVLYSTLIQEALTD